MATPSGYKFPILDSSGAATSTVVDMADMFVRKELFLNSGVYMWGSNIAGGLGNNSTKNYSSPVQIGSLSTWRQVISGNTSYNPENYPNNEVPLTVLAQDLLNCFRLGWKTLYYQNTYDIKTDEVVEDKDQLQSLLEDLMDHEEDDCESCKL